MQHFFKEDPPAAPSPLEREEFRFLQERMAV
jgi:hypothetical protein